MNSWLLFLCTFIWASFNFHCSASNVITRENLKKGSSSWWIEQRDDESGPSGFSTRFSVDPGDAVGFKVSAKSTNFNVTIYRLGYYGGKGASQYAQITAISHELGLRTFTQPPCTVEFESRMVDCSNWNLTLTWIVPKEAVSGVYVAVLESFAEGRGNYIPFVVRRSHESLGSDILFKTSDLTWVAYNKYGGWNLYRGNGSFTFESRAKKVSYNRPFSNRLPRLKGGQHQNFLFGTEFAMIFWLEKHGYDVSYGSCADVEMWGESYQLQGKYSIILSVGHDEYWTPGLKRAFESAREHGTHLGFFSGNEIFWRVRWQDAEGTSFAPALERSRSGASSTGNSSHLAVESENRFRIVICYKETIDGMPLFPTDADKWTGTFMDPRFRNPEPQNALTGQLFMVNAHNYSEPMEVGLADSKLRFWRGTALATMTTSKYVTTPGLLGYEWDMFADDCYRPPGLFTLSSTTVELRGALMETYGASYKGSGKVNHRLTLYRHICKDDPPPQTTLSTTPANAIQVDSAAHSSASLTTATTTQKPMMEVLINWLGGLTWLSSLAGGPPSLRRERDSNLSEKQKAAFLDLVTSVNRPRRSSLVFGAGTIQWPWALSSWHDGDKMEEDPNLQQATVNLFADMGVQPGDLRSTAAAPLVKATQSSDSIPPKSSVLIPRHRQRVFVNDDGYIRISGTAVDFGGGRVAAVEVSIDDGKTWRMAVGRERWVYRHYVEEYSQGCLSSQFKGPYSSHPAGSRMLDRNASTTKHREYLAVHAAKLNTSIDVIEIRQRSNNKGNQNQGGGKNSGKVGGRSKGIGAKNSGVKNGGAKGGGAKGGGAHVGGTKGGGASRSRGKHQKGKSHRRLAETGGGLDPIAAASEARGSTSRGSRKGSKRPRSGQTTSGKADFAQEDPGSEFQIAGRAAATAKRPRKKSSEISQEASGKEFQVADGGAAGMKRSRKGSSRGGRVGDTDRDNMGGGDSIKDDFAAETGKENRVRDVIGIDRDRKRVGDPSARGRGSSRGGRAKSGREMMIKGMHGNNTAIDPGVRAGVQRMSDGDDSREGVDALAASPSEAIPWLYIRTRAVDDSGWMEEI